MSKKISKPIIILIAILVGLVISSCTPNEQYAFFVTLGDEEAKTQTLEQARSEWTYEDATLEQHSVLRHLQSPPSYDCIGAMQRVFPPSAHSWGRAIIMRESRNQPTAQNRSSSAAGCWQLLRMHDHRYYSVGCTPAQKYDALCNTKAAFTLYRDAGTSPWNV